MPFRNEITGAEGELARTRIKSKNFVAGVDGWDIESDGTAEFNDVTVRGTLTAVNPTTGSSVTLTPTVDALTAGIEIQPPTQVGHTFDPAQVDAVSTPGGNASLNLISPTDSAAPQDARIVLTSTPSGQSGSIVLNTGAVNGNGLIDLSNVDSFRIDNLDQPLGLLWAVASTSASAAVTAETVIASAPSVDYKAGRAYRIVIKGLARSGAGAALALMQVRDTNAAGTVRASALEVNIPAINVNYTFTLECVVGNLTGATITRVLALTLASSNANAVVINAGATVPRYVQCWDIGLASDHPEAVAL